MASIFYRAALINKVNPRESKQLFKLYDKLDKFFEKVAAKKGK